MGLLPLIPLRLWKRWREEDAAAAGGRRGGQARQRRAQQPVAQRRQVDRFQLRWLAWQQREVHRGAGAGAQAASRNRGGSAGRQRVRQPLQVVGGWQGVAGHSYRRPRVVSACGDQGPKAEQGRRCSDGWVAVQGPCAAHRCSPHLRHTQPAGWPLPRPGSGGAAAGRACRPPPPWRRATCRAEGLKVTPVWKNAGLSGNDKHANPSSMQAF